MIVEHFKARLLAKQRELVEAIARSQEEGRIAAETDVADSADRAVADEQADAGLQSLSADAETLQTRCAASRKVLSESVFSAGSQSSRRGWKRSPGRRIVWPTRKRWRRSKAR
jgi:hypothetical protein